MSNPNLPDVPVYLEVLGQKTRKIVYTVLVLLGAASTAIAAFYAATPGHNAPWWYAGAAAALNALLTGGVFLALNKVNASPAQATQTKVNLVAQANQATDAVQYTEEQFDPTALPSDDPNDYPDVSDSEYPGSDAVPDDAGSDDIVDEPTGTEPDPSQQQ